MAVLPKNVPRFLPTLTEVVQPRAGLPRSPANDGRLDVDGDLQAIADSVRGQVDTELDSLLRDAVATAVLEQVDAIAARLREEVEPILRQAVADMVANEIAARRRV